MTETIRKDPIKLKCPDCDHVWVYKGTKLKYVHCPVCMKSITIAKHAVKDS